MFIRMKIKLVSHLGHRRIHELTNCTILRNILFCSILSDQVKYLIRMRKNLRKTISRKQIKIKFALGFNNDTGERGGLVESLRLRSLRYSAVLCP